MDQGLVAFFDGGKVDLGGLRSGPRWGLTWLSVAFFGCLARVVLGAGNLFSIILANRLTIT